MADLLQKVFMVLVRPYYVDSQSRKVFHTGTVYTTYTPPGGTQGYTELKTNNDLTAPATSPVKLNSKGAYSKDPWFLHSTYTSYPEMQEELKNLIAVYGTDNVKVAIYVPIDYQVTPVE